MKDPKTRKGGKAEDAETDEGEECSRKKLPALPKELRERPLLQLFIERQKLPKRESTDHVVTKKELERAARSLGLGQFPPSYVEFVTRLGHLSEWFLAYKHDLLPRWLSVLLPQRLQLHREDFDLKLDSRAKRSPEAKVNAKVIRKLVPFGSDASHMDLCWDPAQMAEDRELGLCFVDFDGDARSMKELRLDCGSHLMDVIKYYRYERD